MDHQRINHEDVLDVVKGPGDAADEGFRHVHDDGSCSGIDDSGFVLFTERR